MIHVFHGFLGSPRDFEFLRAEEVLLHDLYHLNVNKIAGEIFPDDILIGYSMGGRLALELASRVNYKIKKLILISAHPGLSTEEEKRDRAIWESQVLDQLKSSSGKEFMVWWNSLSIFNSDEALPPLDMEVQKKSIELFDRFRLSAQKNFLPEVQEHKDKVLWLIGRNDSKYVALAREHLAPAGIKYHLVEGGHRLFQKPQSLLSVLNEEDIL